MPPQLHGLEPVNVQMSKHVLRTDELDYQLPQELIATRPVEPRDSARMLVMSRCDDTIEHRQVRDLPRYLRSGDAMVFNTTAVVRAGLIGRRVDTGGRVEGLFLDEPEPGRWLVMLRSNGRLRRGQQIELLDPQGRPQGHRLELLDRQAAGWVARVLGPGSATSVLDRVGHTPLPPYIRRARGDQLVADALDRQWYQTVYADAQQRGSVAAPTAGLHFTPDLLARIEKSGVQRIDVMLHIGLGTFQPITSRWIDQHVMHAEHYAVSPEAIAALRELRKGRRGRIFAVGSTVVRALESLPEPLPQTAALDGPFRGQTNLLIAPPYQFKHVDGMLTNFHLPRSTLLALVAAMIGLDRLKAVYHEAIEQRYRFYSYGDAMLILP